MAKRTAFQKAGKVKGRTGGGRKEPSPGDGANGACGTKGQGEELGFFGKKTAYRSLKGLSSNPIAVQKIG